MNQVKENYANKVDVGDNNSGKVAGGHIIENQFLPCKNGDGFLTEEDYDRLPYCNTCIRNTHSTIRRRFIFLAITFAVVTIAIYFYKVQQLPTFLSFFFIGDMLFKEQVVQLFSALLLCIAITLVFRMLFHMLASIYNKVFYPLHR